MMTPPNLPRSFVLELAALIWHSRVLEAHLGSSNLELAALN